MPKFLADELEQWVGSLLIGEDERIFIFTKAKLHHELGHGCKCSYVKRIRIHDFHHSHVSLLIEMGFSAVAIAKRLGYESSDATFRYTRLFPDKQDFIMERLHDEAITVVSNIWVYCALRENMLSCFGSCRGYGSAAPLMSDCTTRWSVWPRSFIDLRGEIDAATVNTERYDILEINRR